MSDRLLLATTTGEPFQPARLHYSVRDRQQLEAILGKLQCMDFDEERNRWVWHYNGEARSLKFGQTWKKCRNSVWWCSVLFTFATAVR